MKPDRLFVLFIAVAAMLGELAVAAQFKKATIDTTASYAIRMTLGDDGTWKGREVFKLCQLSVAGKGTRGETIRFAAVSATRECPKQAAVQSTK